MRKRSKPPWSWLCAIFGHRLEPVRPLPFVDTLLRCRWCRRLFVRNSRLGLTLPWEDAFEKIYGLVDDDLDTGGHAG